MNGEPRPSDDRLAALERAVAALDARLGALEAGGAPAMPREIDEDPPAPRAGPALDPVALMTLVGRTLVVLGGAYLLRALTEAGVWPPLVGVAAGFAYAASWLVAVDRAGRRGLRVSAIFHGLSATIIALPILWEAVTKFGAIGGGGAAAILTATAMAVLTVAVRARLQTVAWMIVLGAVVSSLALTAATGAVLPFAVADIALGVVTLWIGYTIDWVWLRWPVAASADIAVLALAAGVASRTASNAPSTIVAVQLTLMTGYLASIAIRTLIRGRDVNVFEALQGGLALAVGFGGAVFVARASGTGGALLAGIALASGVGCYAVAFAFVARHQGLRHNFYFYTSLALALVLAASMLGLGEPSLLWAALAVLSAWTATRVQPPAGPQAPTAAPAEGFGASLGFTLALHAAVYFVAAALASNLLASSLAALVGPPIRQSPFSPMLFTVFAAGCLCWLIPAPTPIGRADRFVIVPRLLIAMVVAAAGAAWLVVLVVSDGTDAGLVATIRTAVLATTALALAWAGAAPRTREAGWLVYPTLVAGAVKLLAEDLPRSTAATLFVALAAYGGALIAAPHLMRAARIKN